MKTNLLRPSRQHSFATALMLILVATAALHAQIAPSQDAYTNTATPTTNYGAKTLLDVESSQTAYIQFNLSSLPSGYTGANISKATLKLYVNSVATAGNFNVDYVNGTWSEGTIDASNAPALGSTIAASVPLTTADKNQFILVDITTAVQAWLNGTDPNDGIALVGNSPLNATFDSKENTTTSHAAELDLVFAGGSGTITGVNTAASSGLTGGGTSGTLNLSLITTCKSGQILSWNGSAWVCTTVKGTGTVTSVGSGTGLTGGPITTSGTLSIDTTKVPLLASSNTFTSEQIINASGIGPGLSVTSGEGIYSVGNGVGVTGVTTKAGLLAAGVQGMDQSSTGAIGVYGFSSVGEGVSGGSATGYGVVGGGGTAGVWGSSSAGEGVLGTSTSGLAVSGSVSGTGVAVYGLMQGTAGQGVWGETNGTSFFNGVGSDGVHGVAHSSAGAGVAGVNNATNGTGVYGSDTSGYGFVTDSHVSQGRTAGGWVKAMVFIQGSSGISRCFNSQLSGSVASTPPCGMKFTYNGAGSYTLDFGFEVDDRFVSTAVVGPPDGSFTWVGTASSTALGVAVWNIFNNTLTDNGVYLTIF